MNNIDDLIDDLRNKADEAKEAMDKFIAYHNNQPLADISEDSEKQKILNNLTNKWKELDAAFNEAKKTILIFTN